MIELAAPWGLLGLLALPVIVLLHRLRPRRVDVAVPSTRLWREALRSRRRGFGWQRLLRDARLVLLVLAALALGAALGDPGWLGESSGATETVVVVDVSASMQARSGRTTRFELARARARALLDALPDEGRMLVMTSGRHPGLRSGFESDRELLRSVIAGLAPTDEAGRPGAAIELAASLLRDPRAGRVHFLTDGAFDEDLARWAEKDPVQVEVLTEGSPARNVAITRFDVRPEVGTEERFEMLLGLHNYDGARWAVPVRVVSEGRVLLEQTVDLSAGASEVLVVPFAGPAVGWVQATLEIEDDLAADNRAYAVVAADERLRVLLFGGANVYLERGLRALANVEVTRLEEFRADRFAGLEAAHDVTVFDRIPPPEIETASRHGRFLLIDTLPPGLPFTARGWVEQPVITGRGASPLVEGLDLAGVRIERARRVRVDLATPGLERLFWSPDTELALAYLSGERRLVYLGFDVARSTFPLQAAFPLFLQSSLDWLRPRASRFAATQARAGEAVTIAVARPPAALVVDAPAGRHEQWVEAGSLAFEHTSRAGLYRYRLDGVERHFAVNLTDARESDLAARGAWATAEAGSAALAAGASREVRGRIRVGLWPYLVLLAAAALAAEAALGWRTGRA